MESDTESVKVGHHEPFVGPKVHELFSKNLIVDICDVPLKICFQITAVATVTALVFLQLRYIYESRLISGKH